MSIEISIASLGGNEDIESVSVQISWDASDIKASEGILTEAEKQAIRDVGQEGVYSSRVLRALAKIVEQFEADDRTISMSERDDFISRVIYPDEGSPQQ
jgi:hypothetical protein